MSTCLAVAVPATNGNPKFPPKTRTFPLLERCKTMREVHQIHAHMITTGAFNHSYPASRILAFCVDASDLNYARSIFDRFEEPNSFFWFTMIRGYSNTSGNAKEAIVLFCQMLQFTCLRLQFAIPFVLKACSRILAAGEGKQVHAHVVKSSYLSDSFIANALIQMYVSFADLSVARQVFVRMVKRDMVSWTTMIGGYGKLGKVETAHELFEEMPQRDLVAWNVMIDAHVKCRRMEDAQALFDQMPERGVVSWNSMINGYVKCGKIELAQHLFDEMPKRDIVSWNSMIDGYVKCNQLEKARKMFDEMPARDAVSWTTLIVGYIRGKLHKESMALFKGMMDEHIKPDSATLAVVPSAIASLGLVDEGRWVHAYIRRHGFELDGTLGSALIDMYSKCGFIGIACRIFEDISKRSIGHWNAMISGLAMHGLAQDAVQVFNEMTRSGTQPDEITFIGLLNACSHAGLLSEGRMYFNLMKNKYNLEPRIQHFGCMIDLLGRAGHIEEASIFIDEMPIQPDPTLLKAFLSACWKHGNVKVGEAIGFRLIELVPHDSSCYILLSNLYAKAKMWESVTNMRKLMKGKGVSKVPGCSTIMINGVVHEFFAGQDSGARCEEAMTMLRIVTQRLKCEGYVPDLSQVLLDVEENEKESSLSSHSEKLAIAFGLLNVKQ